MLMIGFGKVGPRVAEAMADGVKVIAVRETRWPTRKILIDDIAAEGSAT
jgi:hypothetical protein